MKHYLTLLFMLFVLFVSLTACAETANVEPTPPAIHYGEDICEACGMIISDARYAAAYITADGEGRTFDEVAGMIITHLDKQEDVVAFFVHDYQTQDWIRGETATYVLSSDLVTPMALGLIAFDSTTNATEFMTQSGSGQLFSFEEVLAHYEMNNGMDMSSETMPDMEHTHDDNTN